MGSSRYRTDFGRKSAKSSLETTMSLCVALKPLGRPPSRLKFVSCEFSREADGDSSRIGPPATCVDDACDGRRVGTPAEHYPDRYVSHHLSLDRPRNRLLQVYDNTPPPDATRGSGVDR